MQLQPTAKFISATVLVSAIGLSLGIGQASGAEVALVESVSGRVVAFAAGKPTLLDALDVVSEGTQLDLQANSELRICHYKMRQFLTLRGPLRASISLDGVAVENRKTVLSAAGSCGAPAPSTYSGGVVIRSVAPIPVSDVSGKR
jgi:hypothetical protein